LKPPEINNNHVVAWSKMPVQLIATIEELNNCQRPTENECRRLLRDVTTLKGDDNILSISLSQRLPGYIKFLHPSALRYWLDVYNVDGRDGPLRKWISAWDWMWATIDYKHEVNSSWLCYTD
jgi:hypothetical protein